MDRQEFKNYLRHVRGVEDPCQSCQGLGVRSYSSTATWRGGMGGQAFTQDVCDKCWGSGDVSRPWADIRKMERARADWEENQVFEYLARRLGCGLSGIKGRISQLAAMCNKESNRRKIPEGEHVFKWCQDWQMLGSILNRLYK